MWRHVLSARPQTSRHLFGWRAVPTVSVEAVRRSVNRCFGLVPLSPLTLITLRPPRSPPRCARHYFLLGLLRHRVLFSGPAPLSSSIVRLTDFDVTIGQCVESDRNPAFDILIRHSLRHYRTGSRSLSAHTVTTCFVSLLYDSVR